MSRTSIIKESSRLREALRDRWKEVKWSQKQVAQDAISKGQKGMNRQGISKYMTDPYAPGALNDYQITWLAFRWGIFLTLGVGVSETNARYVVPKKFTKEVERVALKALKEFFPETIL